MKKLLVLMMASVCVAAMALPAMADTSLYGSARMATFYKDIDNGANAGDAEDLEFVLQGNSRFGMKSQLTKELAGRFELGAPTPGTSATRLRLLYGTYNFGAGTLTIGQDYAPFDLGAPQVANEDDDLAPYALSIARSPQMTARFDMGLYVSLIRNQKELANHVDLPLLAVGYDGKVAQTAFGVGAAYMEFKVGQDNPEAWFVYGQVEQGLGKVSLLAKLYYGQNVADIGTGNASAVFNAATGSDATTLAGYVALVGSITDSIGFATGIGYLTTDTDIAGQQDDEQMTYYIDLPIQIAKGFQVVPSVTMFDFMENGAGADEGNQLWVGAKWQMDF